MTPERTLLQAFATEAPDADGFYRVVEATRGALLDL
jgi:hypothetical protein